MKEVRQMAKTKMAPGTADGQKPVATKPAAQKKTAKVVRQLLGNAKDGVRAHPSYDHPGDFYAVEASTRRRVFSGYHTVEEIKTWCAKNRVKFLGVVAVTGKGANSGYNKSSVEKAVKTHGATVRKAAARPVTKKGATKDAAATKGAAKPTAKPKATRPVPARAQAPPAAPETEPAAEAAPAATESAAAANVEA